MSRPIYTLADPDDIRRLGNATRRVERQPLGGGPRRRGRYSAGAGTIEFGLADGTIGPASITSGVITYASGDAFLYDDDGTDLTPRSTATTVYSDLEETIPDGARLRLGWYRGKLWVLGYVCEEA